MLEFVISPSTEIFIPINLDMDSKEYEYDESVKKKTVLNVSSGNVEAG